MPSKEVNPHNLAQNSDSTYEWPMSNRKVADLLGLRESTIRRKISRYKNELIQGKGKDYWSERTPEYTTGVLPTVWSKEGAIFLARHCEDKTGKAKIFLKNVGEQETCINYYERQPLSNIAAAIKGFTRYIRDYRVYEYKVDLYLLDWKIAVECDEEGHQNRQKYPKREEETRQQFIESHLGCKFVRFNPQEDDFLIGKVINEILSIHFLTESQSSV
jgi:very-short-patch-repair endonuclease